ncbi:MAG: response regulator [Acidobacteriota bacterium]
MATLLLIGLNGPKHDRFRQTLRGLGHSLVPGHTPSLPSVDLAFCDGDHADCRTTLQSMRTQRPSLPVIAVTLLPDEGKWLDALEAGAADYCGASFESTSLRWILDGVLRPKPLTHPVAA